MTERKKIGIAIVASVLLHVVIFFLIVLWGVVAGLLNRGDKPLANLKVVEVSVAKPTPAPIDILPLLPAAPQPPAVSSDGLVKTDKAPERPVFESDENSRAASEKAGSGLLPLPTQEGKERKELAFQTQNFTLGQGSASNASPPVLEFAPAPLSEPTRPVTTPVPQRKTVPQEKPTRKPGQTATPAPTVTPVEKVAATTPTPIPASEEPLYRPTPVPTETPMPTPDLARPTPVPTPVPSESVAMLSTPAPRQQPRPAQQTGYRPETEQNKIEGGISNRGRTGLDALGTPVGRYRKKIADAIGSRWYSYVNDRMDLITSGSVRIKFYINKNGHVEDLKIMSNDANQALVNYSVQAITAARIPPPPAELAPSLEDGRYEVEYTFTIYPD